MVPFRKSPTNIQNFTLKEVNLFSNSPNLIVHDIENIRRHYIPVNSPLQEFEVFSDFEEELEYMDRVHKDLPKKSVSSSKYNRSVQCDMSPENYTLQCIAPREHHLRENIKLNGDKQIDEYACSDTNENIHVDNVENVQVKDVLELTSKCHLENATKNELHQLVTLLHSITRNYDVNVKESDISSSTCKRKNSETQRKRKILKIGKRNEDICEHEKKCQNELTPIKDSSIVEEKTKVNKNKNNFQTFRTSSDKQDLQISSSKKLGQKKSQKVSRIDSPEADLKKSVSPEFKKPMKKKSLAKNWMSRSHSLIFNNEEKQNLHFASFQTNLNMRRLYTPGDWLDSKEFEKSLSQS